jgi:Domain of unknown function (DUF6265)
LLSGALVALAAPSHAQTSPADALSWMAGCWIRVNGASTVEEQWMAPKGGMLLGVSRTTAAGRTREYEQLKIVAAGDTLVYGALPSRQAYTEFRATKVGNREVVFENLKNDFPQRIGYRASGDSLLAYIEGPQGGTTRRIPFPYVRTSCPGPK